jgi:hypothetical protein
MCPYPFKKQEKKLNYNICESLTIRELMEGGVVEEE